MTFEQVINTDDIRRETLDGTEYVVAPITILKNMYLNTPGDWSANEAYLPKQEAKASVPSWNNTPLTLNHPQTANGVSTTANSPEMVEKVVLGRVFNAEDDDGEVNGEAWFNEEKIRNMGGEAEKALETVLDEGTVEVSSGYRASRMPSGEYDGETHNAVQGNIKPDHVAVLPNAKGKCSIEAGCGVGEAVANSLCVTNAQADDPETGEDAGEVPEGVEERDGRVAAQTVSHSNSGTMTDDLDLENPDDQTKQTVGERVMNALGWGTDGEQSGNEGAESSADSTDTDMTDLENEDMIQELADNTDFDRENLEAWDGTDCLGQLYENHLGESEETEPEETAANEAPELEGIPETVANGEQTLDEYIDERLAKNDEEQTKAELITEITANDESYEADELEGTPVGVLENIRDDVVSAEPDFSATIGANAQPGSSEENSGDDLKMFAGDE